MNTNIWDFQICINLPLNSLLNKIISSKYGKSIIQFFMQIIPNRNQVNKPLPNFMIFKFLLFRLYLKKYGIIFLVIYTQQKSSCKILSQFFQLFHKFMTLDVKVALAMPSLTFIKFRNWKISTAKIKNSISIKLRYFHCLSHSLLYWQIFF